MSIVTIVTRTKDRPRLLARAIKSVLGQTHQDWEHIIVNDGGERAHIDSLLVKNRDAYQDRLKVIHLKDSIGMQQAANRGIEAGHGEFVCIHDDDDSWAPRFLARCVEFLQKAGEASAYQGVITHTLLIEEQIGPRGAPKQSGQRPYIPLDEISLFRLGFENPFPPIAFCFRRKGFEQVGPFNPAFNVAGDYEFNFRFLCKFEIGVLPEPLAHYHIRVKSSKEADGNSVQVAAREHKIRYNELKNHYLRSAQTDRQAALALAFNTARYLVEIEWATHETRKRARSIEETLQGTTQSLTRRLEAHEVKVLDALSSPETAEYRKNLLSHLDALTIRSEEHAENLWKDLNARTREMTLKIAEMETALLGRHAQTQAQLSTLENTAAQEAIRDRLEALSIELDQKATLQTLLNEIATLAENHSSSSRNLWSDLNARARENVAAIEANAKQRTEDLRALHEANQTAAEETGKALVAMREAFETQLGELRQTRESEAEINQHILHQITTAIESLSQKTTTIEEKLEAERKAQRPLFRLGRLGIFWRRPPSPVEKAPDPEA